MKLRATIEFPPDEHGTLADAVVEYPNAYTGADSARRWQSAMESLTPGAVAMELEVYCEDCRRWESLDSDTCEACGFDFCGKVLAANALTCHGAYLCDECAAKLELAPIGERAIARSLGLTLEGGWGAR